MDACKEKMSKEIVIYSQIHMQQLHLNGPKWLLALHLIYYVNNILFFQ